MTNSFAMRDAGHATGCGLHYDCGFDRSGRKVGDGYSLLDDINHGGRARGAP